MSARKNTAMPGLVVLVFVLFGVVLAGCGDKGAEEVKATPTPASSPTPAAGTPAPTKAEKLHGKGTCDMCHDAPTLEKMRSGDHKLAFERDPDLHKNLCGNCHEVNSFCGKCHPVPEVVKG